MNLSVNIRKRLTGRRPEIAATGNVSVDELFAAAIGERLFELERLKEKSRTWQLRKIPTSHCKGSGRRTAGFDRL